MATLHFLFDYRSLHKLTLTEEDALVLLNDACLIAQNKALHLTTPVFVRQADCEARGILNNITNTVSVIDDAQWLDLSLNYDKVISWP